MRGPRSYLLVVAVVAVSVALRWAAWPILHLDKPFLLFFPTVMLCGWFGGRGPGLLATALCALASTRFLEWSASDVVGLTVFVAVGVTVSALLEGLHRAREDAELVREQLFVTLRSIGDAVLATDRDERVTFLNPVAERLTGWPLAEASGRPVREVFTIVNELTGRPVDSPIPRVIREGIVVGLANHTALISRAGERTSIADSGAPIRDERGEIRGAVLVFRDVTAERRAQEELVRWEQTFANAGWAVAIAHPTTNVIQAANPAFAALHGWTVEEVVGKPLGDTFAPEERHRIAELTATTHAMGHQVYEAVHLRRDGTRFPVLTHVSAIKDGQGTVLYRAATVQDLTELKAAETSLREADRRKNEFLAMLAHELRNPLASVTTAVELLRVHGGQDERAARYREVIDRQTGQLTRMIDDLLDVSRITRGTINLVKAPIDVRTIAARAVETSRPLIDGKRHALRVAVPAEPVLVEADETRLTQVVANLLNNAAKYTDDGGHIELEVVRGEGEVTLTVRDDGVGIAPGMLTAIFELFTQGDRGLDRAHGGLGIGLTIVRTLVERHGGTVRASSAGPGRGSEFTVRLPTIPAPAASPSATRAADPPPPSAPRRRILLVDDNEDSRVTFAEYLELLGHEVRSAASGPDGLALARELRPELVLLDIGLPGMDGYEVARRLRAEHGAAVRLVAVTGYGQGDDRRRAREAGFDEHLTKPVQPRVIEALLAGAPLPAAPGPSS